MSKIYDENRNHIGNLGKNNSGPGMEPFFNKKGEHLGFIKSDAETGLNIFGALFWIIICVFFYYTAKIIGGPAGYWVAYAFLLAGWMYLMIRYAIPEITGNLDSRFMKIFITIILLPVLVLIPMLFMFCIGDLVTEKILGYQMFIDKILPIIFR